MLSEPLTLNLQTVHLSDEQFYQLCITNPNLRVERTPTGGLVLMPPVGGESGNREMSLGGELYLWNRQTGLGQVFSSSTIFQLPGGGGIGKASSASFRSPDAAWIEQCRWDALATDEKAKFPPIAPDFVLELRSRTDSLTLLQEKMQEYLDSGVRLGWLFNPQDQQVEIYRQGQPQELRLLPTILSGDSVLPDFKLQVDLF